MEESIVIPSPNWFLVTILGASSDGWVVYGGPCKSLVFLEPIPSEIIGVIDSNQRYKTHYIGRAHKERLVSVDICPEWPEKRNVITGGAEGVVKEWNLEKGEKGWEIKYIQCHEFHYVENEEIVGVSYGSQVLAVSVGSRGNICKWDLTTNIVKPFYTNLKAFKPSCISCSPHKLLHVAVGTRQGVIFVFDISGTTAKLIYKVRGQQDDEINKVHWCPQYKVTMTKAIGREKKKKHEPYTAAVRMQRIRNNQDPSGLGDVSTPDNDQPQEEEEVVIVPEDDMFDVYKDHEANEFGHKKYEPEDIVVKNKEECKDDFLAECAKLKAVIIKNKNEPEESIESLVEAMDKANVIEKPGDSKDELGSEKEAQESRNETEESSEKSKEPKNTFETFEQKHLLASIGKFGSVRIWSMSGTQVASCSVKYSTKKDNDYKNKGSHWPTLIWFKPDSLVIADGKNQLLVTNPLNLDCKNKHEWRVAHTLHRRSLFCVVSNAPRVQTPASLQDPAAQEWLIWTVGQDRLVISYNLSKEQKIEMFMSCGSNIYDLKPCPYDAGKIAMGVGDGAIRIWETHTTTELEDQLASGVATSYWQNVQGKVLVVAWHPTKENLLAFSTGECRVGLLDASGNNEKPAKNLLPTLSNGVYSLCWGEGMSLYACGGGKLALFRAEKIDAKPEIIKVSVEGQSWVINLVLHTPHGLLVGSNSGGVALLDHSDRHVITANIVFLKSINSVAWHPKQITSSHDESKFKNYIAVASTDRSYHIGILEFDDKEGVKQFKTLAPLIGHLSNIHEVVWNPHRDATLLSTSLDTTVRVWDVKEGVCLSIFASHSAMSLGAMWCPQPALADKVLSGGADCCVRLWDIKDHPAENYKVTEFKPNSKLKQAKSQGRKGRANIEAATVEVHQKTHHHANETTQPESPSNVATTSDYTLKGIQHFLLPITTKQANKQALTCIRAILSKYVAETKTLTIQDIIKEHMPAEKHLDFIKLFGTINEVNELLDEEAESQLKLCLYDSYLMLLFYRGKVDDMIRFAYERDLLDSYLLSLTPSVSFKFWKDTVQLYLTQMDRNAAKFDSEDKNYVKTSGYGGMIFRKATMLLCSHDLKGAVKVLTDGNLFKEAYMLCRLRHMDSVAEEVLVKWAEAESFRGSLLMSTLLHLVRGDPVQASTVLARTKEISNLYLARDLAQHANYHTFVTHIEQRLKTLENNASTSETLPELSTRAELYMDDSGSEHGDLDDDVCIENDTVLIEYNSTKNGES